MSGIFEVLKITILDCEGGGFLDHGLSAFIFINFKYICVKT